MNNKKKVPLALWQGILPLLNAHSDIILQNLGKEELISLSDKDDKSNFFFRIVKYEVRGGKPIYTVNYKPRSKDRVASFTDVVDLTTTVSHLQAWLTVLKGYSSIHTIYDDPILKKNQERFEQQFEILDDDAATSSFDLNQQLFLEEYLEKAKGQLEVFKEGKTEAQIKELTSLQTEATQIQGALTTETKKDVIKRLSWWLAKVQKAGLPIIKEVFIKVSTELISELTKKALGM